MSSFPSIVLILLTSFIVSIFAVEHDHIMRLQRLGHHGLFSDNDDHELTEITESTLLTTTSTNPSYSEQNATRCLYFAYGAYCSQKSIGLNHFFFNHYFSSFNRITIHCAPFHSESWTCKWCKHIPNFQVSNVTQKDKLQVFTGFDVEFDQSYLTLSHSLSVRTLSLKFGAFFSRDFISWNA